MAVVDVVVVSLLLFFCAFALILSKILFLFLFFSRAFNVQLPSFHLEREKKVMFNHQKKCEVVSNIIIIADSKLQQWKNVLLVLFFSSLARPFISHEALAVFVHCVRACVCRWKLISFSEIICKTLAILLRHNVSLSLWDWCVCVLCAICARYWVSSEFAFIWNACVCAGVCREHFSAHERHKKWIVAALFLSHTLIVSVDIFNKTISNIFVRCGLSRQFTYIYKYIKHKCEARKSKHTNWHLNI